ncbi:MAG: ABC transporter substrate-binding protein [Myxococcota bacterium]|nr:ABC transporter substrate-binding protein [Myxococcota bacterium]
MNNLTTRLQIGTIAMLALTAGALTMNTCAMDRLEQQVIHNRQAVERLENSGVGGNAVVVSSSAQTSAGVPGTGTGMTAVGWGGQAAELLYVEGAIPGAPITLNQKPKPQNDTYINRRGSPPSSLNYYATNEGDANTVTKYILGRLIEIDPDAPPAVIPSLATSWEVSDDKLKYTYHLRKGVLFADGRPFTAADVKFSFDVMRDPEVNAEHMRSSFDDVISMTTPDDYTVVVEYSKQYWPGLYSIGYGLRVLNKGWVQEAIPRFAEKLEIDEFSPEPGKPGFGAVFNKIRVPGPGTGPYYYPNDEFSPDIPVELVQNPLTWQTQVRPTWWNLRKLKWVYISDPVAAFEEFRKEKFDITVVDFQPWDDEYSKDTTITDIASYHEYDHMGLGFSFIEWNARQPPFDDARVRQAMTHLTNREWILEEVERGRGQVASFPSKPVYATYSHDISAHEFNLDKARELLTEAGWTDTDGDGVLDKDGQRFEFEFKVGSTRRFYTQVTESLKDAAAKVGIRMSVRTLEWSTFIQDFYERRFDAVCLYNSFGDPWIDPYDSYHSSQDIPRGGNSAGWHNDRVDTLLTDMRQEFDETKRNEMFHEFNAIFHEEQPQTLLVHGIVGVLVHKRFKGVKVRPTGMRIHEFWVEPEDTLYQ